MTIEEVKSYKIKMIGQQCQDTVFFGVDVAYNAIKSHYSLTLNDQQNIAGIELQMKQEDFIPLYHADGELCRIFPREEMTAVIVAAMQYKTYHTTLCNHINTWINKCETKDNVLAVTYNAAALPSDLQESMKSLLGLETL